MSLLSRFKEKVTGTPDNPNRFISLYGGFQDLAKNQEDSKKPTSSEEEKNEARKKVLGVVTKHYNSNPEGREVVSELDISQNLDQHVDATAKYKLTLLGKLLSDINNSKQVVGGISKDALETLLSNPELISKFAPEQLLPKYEILGRIARYESGKLIEGDNTHLQEDVKFYKGRIAERYAKSLETELGANSEVANLFRLAIAGSGIKGDEKKQLAKIANELRTIIGNENEGILYDALRDSLANKLVKTETRDETMGLVYQLLKGKK